MKNPYKKSSIGIIKNIKKPKVLITSVIFLPYIISLICLDKRWDAGLIKKSLLTIPLILFFPFAMSVKIIWIFFTKQEEYGKS